MKTKTEAFVDYLRTFSTKTEKFDHFDMKHSFEKGCEFAERWIPLEEENPPYYKPVFVKYKSSDRDCEDVACCWLAVCDNGSHEWTINGTDHFLFSNSVTHWRPINIE